MTQTRLAAERTALIPQLPTMRSRGQMQNGRRNEGTKVMCDGERMLWWNGDEKRGKEPGSDFERMQVTTIPRLGPGVCSCCRAHAERYCRAGGPARGSWGQLRAESTGPGRRSSLGHSVPLRGIRASEALDTVLVTSARPHRAKCCALKAWYSQVSLPGQQAPPPAETSGRRTHRDKEVQGALT